MKYLDLLMKLKEAGQTAERCKRELTNIAESGKSELHQTANLKAAYMRAEGEFRKLKDQAFEHIRPKAKKKTERRALTDQETENVLHTIQNHEHGLFLAVLYYLGLRRGEALGLQWGDFDFDEDLVHIQRDIDYVGSTAHDDALKTTAVNRYIPIPQELRAMLSKVHGFPQQYVFHTEEGQQWPQSSFKRIWLSLMEASCCVEEREVTKATKRKNDIIKQLRPTLTLHYFRHNCATLLFEAGVEPLIAMKILGHTDYQTTANICTHLKSEMMKKSSVDMEDVFRQKQEAKGVLAKAQTTRDKRSRKPVLDMSLPWAGEILIPIC